MNIEIVGIWPETTDPEHEKTIVFCEEVFVDGEPLKHHGFRIECDGDKGFLSIRLRVTEETFDDFMASHEMDDVLEGTGVQMWGDGNVERLVWSPSRDDLILPVSDLNIRIAASA